MLNFRSILHSFRSPQRNEEENEEEEKINWKTNHYVEQITEYVFSFLTETWQDQRLTEWLK